ncbi:HAD-IIA family hydrolase [Vallitalea okinawensis]|uniref:HAD-IIA family hydrolase n=1 Tax=Vallitalea okinawensis TaxID=2078660 RepID=UPI000CFA8672|nr:HAD-IIA family hydrolase [Vallitalea okinawensis]
MRDLNSIQCYLLDMDGTFYLGNELIDGAMDFVKTLEKQGKEYLFLTNNSSKNRYAYQEKLAKLGCEVVPDRVFTSGEATTIYLEDLRPNAKVFLLGTPFLEEEFEKAGFDLIHSREEKPDYIVLGFDTTITYEKLWMACDFIREGIPYIATHPDYNCPLEGGKFMPDSGAIIDFIAASTGVRPHIVGKPNKDIIDAICKKYGYKKEEIAMVGDRLYTDIRTGMNANITTILVLSGETNMEDYKVSDVTANYIFPSLKELGEELNIG